MKRVFSKALILAFLLSLSASCKKLRYTTSSFNVGAKGSSLIFSYRTRGTGTGIQNLGDIILWNDLEAPILSMKLTVVRRGDKVFLQVNIMNWTFCSDNTVQGSQCNLKTTPSSVFPLSDDCTFNFTPTTYGYQFLSFKEEGDFLEFFINDVKVGKVARPEFCGYGYREDITGISGSGKKLMTCGR